MTYDGGSSRQHYSGNGAATQFPTGFKFFANAHVHAVLTADGVDVDLVEGTDYSLSGAGESSGGLLVFPLDGSAYDLLTSGQRLTIYNDPEIVQARALSESSSIHMEEIEGALDYLTAQIDALADKLGRVPKYPESYLDSSIGTPDELLAGLLSVPEMAAQAAASAEAAADSAASVDAEALELLISGSRDELLTLLLSEAMKNAVRASDPDRSYLGNGWLDPLSDASQVALTGMEFQAGDTGYIQPIPAATGLTAVSSTSASLALQGSITTLIVDTSPTGAHFDAAINDRIRPGCRITTPEGNTFITAISGDGTAANSVTIAGGSLALGAHTITTLYGSSISAETPSGYRLTRHNPGGTAVAAVDGTVISGPLTWTEPAAAFDGTTSQAWGASARTPSNSTTPQYIGKSWGEYKSVNRFTVYGSSDYGVTVAANSNETFYVALQGSNDGTTWDTLYTSALLTDSNGIVVDVASGIAVAQYNRHRLLFTSGDGTTRDWRIAEVVFYEYLFVCPTGVYYPVQFAGIVTTDWAALTALTVAETLYGQSIAWLVSFGNNLFKAWTGAAWLEVVRYSGGSWQYWNGSEWITGSIQNPLWCASLALDTAGNRMSGATLNALTEAQLLEGGFTAGQTLVLWACLKTTVATVTPYVTSVTASYARLTANGTAEFDAFAAADPDKTKVAFVMQAVDSVTLDTDLKAFARRGTSGSWVQVPLAVDSQFDATRVLVTGELDQPGATSPENASLKLSTYNRKRLKVFQVANYFKEVA